MGTAEQHGWRIAEVERLVSLSRRGILHACYNAPPSRQRRREGHTLSQASERLRDTRAGLRVE